MAETILTQLPSPSLHPQCVCCCVFPLLSSANKQNGVNYQSVQISDCVMSAGETATNLLGKLHEIGF